MKIGIVGCGNVGSATAYACVLRGVGTELVLVDKNHALAQAQAEDIFHATPFAAPIPIHAGSYEELAGAAIVMIAAGVNQQPHESRLDLLKGNAEVFADIIPKIRAAAPHAILVNATNPVDVMTHLIDHFSKNQTKGRVIGSGTILDTARFRALLGQHLGVSPHSIQAYVLGEHGDSEVLHWSGATVANMPLVDMAAQVAAPITQNLRAQIDERVRRAAYRIIQGKGATWYGIGAGMARIAQAILHNEHAVLTCCVRLPEVEGIADVTLSLPHIVAGQGVQQTLYPLLDKTERQKLRRSAEILKQAIQTIGL